jgi:AraC-like DNA-binding protein
VLIFKRLNVHICLPKVQNWANILDMNTHLKLDRLSALLEGLSPRVWLLRGDAAGSNDGKCGSDEKGGQGEGLTLHILAPAGTWPVSVDVAQLTLLVCPHRAGQSRGDLQADDSPDIGVDHAFGGEGAAGGGLGNRGFGSRNGCRTVAHLPADVPSDRWVCGMSFGVAFDGPVGPLFMREFMRPERICLGDAEPSLAQIVQLMATEMQSARCGQPLLMDRAGDILLVGLLRHWVMHPLNSVGLFGGLADPRMARTLVAMHAKPAEPWTLDHLAAEAGMSRTSFAGQFKQVMGLTAGKYLEHLRLAIAQRRVASGQGLKRVAQETGYASPATLSRALGRRADAERAGVVSVD